jgi:hypothetical protein
MAHTQFDDTGQPIDVAGTSVAIKTLLDQLTWWANALNAARGATPYVC